MPPLSTNITKPCKKLHYLGDLEREVGDRERGDGERDLDEDGERELRVLREDDLPLLELREYLLWVGEAAVTPLEVL